VSLRLALRAGAVQGLLVGAVYLLLVLLPLPEGFFREWGWLAGPGAWLGCAFVAARLLRLAPATGVLAAVAGGAAAVLVGLLSHDLGTVLAVVAFGATVGARGDRAKAPRRRRALAGR
jgi:hypothetical protein